MQTIQDRGYVFKRGQALIPSFLAFAVVGLLEGHFPRLVDFDFTAAMENELDDIAGGDAAALDFLRAFYFGSDSGQACRRSPAAAGSSGWSPRTSARSTRAASTRSRCSATTPAATSWSGSAGTGRTCSGPCPARDGAGQRVH